jgi:ribonuclease BN (tRNA processing enzyme)
MIRITVLGGAAACPNPGQGCSAYLLETDGQRLLLDCGPDTLATLQEHTGIDELSSIMISHLHADHTLDLVPLRYGLKYMPGLARRSVPLWLPPGGRAFLNRLASALASGGELAEGFFEEVFQIAEYVPDQPLQLGELTIRFHPTRHYIPCWACRIETAGRAIVYLADTGPFPELISFAEKADLVICEGTHRDEPAGIPIEHRGHLTAREAGALAAATGAGRLLLTHLWATLGVEALRRDAEDTFGQPVDVAAPGLVIEVP